MIWCKCIQKIRDNNGIIVKYEIADLNGEHRIVSKDALKSAIVNNQISVVNLKLAKDGKLMDRATEEQAKLMKKLNIGTVTEADNNAYLKARMIGMAPLVDEKGWTSNFPNGEQIAITPNVKHIASDRKLADKTVIFYGSNKVEFAWGEIYNKVVIKNPTVVSSLVNKDFVVNSSVVFDFDNMDLKIIDIIFKILKTDIRNYMSTDMTVYLVDNNRLSCEEVYAKVGQILKRQKPSSKIGRRCYDIVAYLRLIYSMYLSFNDNSVLKYANDYIVEYLQKVDSISGTNDSYNNFLINNHDTIRKLIMRIREKQ